MSGRGICSVLFLDEVLMVPLSSIVVVVDGERLMYGGFSLSEPVYCGDFEFITDYFCGLSLSPRRGNNDAIFLGSTRSGASTPQRSMIEDSPKEFLTASSREGSFSHLSPRWRSTGAPLAPMTTTTRKENALATMMFPPQMVVPWPETNQLSKRHHAHHKGQLVQSHALHPHAELGSASQ
jgi:hypothetical protein